MSVRYIVSSSDLPITLQRFLQKKTDSAFSVREIKLALSKNKCLVNKSIERFGSRPLYEGDIVDLIEFIKDELKTSRFAFEPTRVLFEDESLLVYDKPLGLSSIDHGLFEIILKEKGQIFAVHRLDKDTTGVIVFAKTKEAEKELHNAFKLRSVHKEYLALVQGMLSKKKGSITSYMGRVREFDGQIVMGSVEKAKGQLAITDWEVLLECNEASLVRLLPKTGRTHQIRCHMSSLGHPLVGDVQYGWKSSGTLRPSSFFLHAAVLQWQRKRFEAPLPSHFSSMLKTLWREQWRGI